jgi:hypothetical protein
MNSHPRQPIIILILLILSMLACRVPQAVSSTPTSLPITPVASRTSTPTAPASSPIIIETPSVRPTSTPEVPDHRIATHRIYGIAGFFDRETSQSFIPRGMNYFILVSVFDHYEDRLFGVGVYDHDRTEADFKAL